MPVRQTSIVGVIVPGAFRLAAEMLRSGVLSDQLTSDAGNQVEVHRLPLGPALCLVPWNAPAPMAAHKVASALAAGAPTILKPSEYAPYATTELARIVGRVLAEQGVDPRRLPAGPGRPRPSAAGWSATRASVRSPSPAVPSAAARSPRPAPRTSPPCSSSSAATTRSS